MTGKRKGKERRGKEARPPAADSGFSKRPIVTHRQTGEGKGGKGRKRKRKEREKLAPSNSFSRSTPGVVVRRFTRDPKVGGLTQFSGVFRILERGSKVVEAP